MNYSTRRLEIKNMVCTRCVKVIRQAFESLKIDVLDLQMGKATIRYVNDQITLAQIEEELRKDDFELVKDKNELITEEVKLLLVAMASDLPISRSKKLSDYLIEKLYKDYSTLSKIFSKVEETTIERYFILLRIEKAKELIEYGEMNFSEIAYELGYNNINHLSRQFKQITEMSMSEYKQQKKNTRKPFDKII